MALKERDDVADLAERVENHLDWVVKTISRMRRDDIDESYLTDEERLMVVALQLKLRVAMPFARKLAASLSQS